MYDPDKLKTVRTKPLQARGKERVRVLLATSLRLFKEYGIDEITTNDIAAQAHVPIGSVYRYYPNKDAIIVAITELYVSDIGDIFDDIAGHPLFVYLSWDEVLLLLIDAWVNYARLNGGFPFLYAIKANPRLFSLNRQSWTAFTTTFKAVLEKRCPETSEDEQRVCFQLCLAAAEMGITDDHLTATGSPLHHQAIGAIARYMLDACNRHTHAPNE